MSKETNQPVELTRFTEDTRLTRQDILESGQATERMLNDLETFIQSNFNIIFTGGAGVGKTKLLQHLLGDLSDASRTLTIEKVPELNLKGHYPNKKVISLDYRGTHDFETTLEQALHHHPTNISLDDLNEANRAVAYLQLTLMGYSVTSTIVGNGISNSLKHLLVLISNLSNGDTDLGGRLIAQNIDILVNQIRVPDGSRKLAEIVELIDYKDGKFIYNKLFEYALQPQKEGETHQEHVWDFKQTGYLSPNLISKLQRNGISEDTYKSLIEPN